MKFKIFFDGFQIGNITFRISNIPTNLKRVSVLALNMTGMMITTNNNGADGLEACSKDSKDIHYVTAAKHLYRLRHYRFNDILELFDQYKHKVSSLSDSFDLFSRNDLLKNCGATITEVISNSTETWEDVKNITYPANAYPLCTIAELYKAEGFFKANGAFLTSDPIFEECAINNVNEFLTVWRNYMFRALQHSYQNDNDDYNSSLILGTLCIAVVIGVVILYRHYNQPVREEPQRGDRPGM